MACILAVNGGFNHANDRELMESPASSTRDLARRLLAVEAASARAADAHLHEAVRVVEKLRVSLTRLAGADGFTSLLRRALALARAEVPSLQGIEDKPDGSALELLAILPGDGAAEAGIAIVAHLLGLLIVFIGEPLTLRLLREAWPGASFDS